MSLNNAYMQYKENSIFTATPEELTLILYNGLIKFIMQAQHAIGLGKLEKANNSIIKAENILNYFLITLDMQYEISNSLALLYDYMVRRLTEANIRKDKEILKEVLDLAKDLRDTWTQAMKAARNQGRAQQQIIDNL